MLTIEDANQPAYITEDRLCISLTVKFAELPDPIPFIAMPNDPAAHGRLLYEQAVAGAYGPVAPHVAPAEEPNAN